MNAPTLSQQGYRGARLVAAIFGTAPETMELLACVLNIGWGVMLILAHPFAAALSNPTSAFRLMAGLSLWSRGVIDGEWLWAIALFVTGALTGVLVWRGVAVRLRIISIGLSLALWTFIWLSLVLSNWRTTGTWIYFLVVVTQFWTLVRLRLASAAHGRQVSTEDATP